MLGILCLKISGTIYYIPGEGGVNKMQWNECTPGVPQTSVSIFNLESGNSTQSKVGKHDFQALLRLGVEKKVFWLEVAVDYITIMGIFYGTEDSVDEICGITVKREDWGLEEIDRKKWIMLLYTALSHICCQRAHHLCTCMTLRPSLRWFNKFCMCFFILGYI